MSFGRTAWLIVAGGVAALVAVPLVMVACGSDSSNNVVDAFDTPAGGLLVNPGIVTCDFVDGGECGVTPGECCLGPGTTGECIDAAAQPAQCPTNSTSIGCNETADCPIGDLCCGTPPPGGGEYVSAQCATSCPAPLVQLCRTNGECSSDKCVIQKCSDGLVYEMCERYASPTFACTVLGFLPDGGLDLGDSATASPDSGSPLEAGDDAGPPDGAASD